MERIHGEITRWRLIDSSGFSDQETKSLDAESLSAFVIVIIHPANAYVPCECTIELINRLTD